MARVAQLVGSWAGTAGVWAGRWAQAVADGGTWSLLK